jgi:hypothetical protein
MLLVCQGGEGKGWSALGMVRVVTMGICWLVSGFVPERVIQVKVAALSHASWISIIKAAIVSLVIFI